jgi:hypothetical protein
MKAWRKETTVCQEATWTYLEKAKANSEKTKGGLEEMEASVNVFEERLNKMNMTDLEANPEGMKSVRSISKSLKNSPQWRLSRRWRTDMGTGVWLKSPWTTEETDPGRWWVPAEVGRCPKTVDPPHRSCTAQGTCS